MSALNGLTSSFIFSTRALDRWQSRAKNSSRFSGRIANRLLRSCIAFRNDVVLLVTSEETMVAYCARTYNLSAVFLPTGPKALRTLWGWEEDAIARFFPAAPARVLIGGAGGGREAFAFAAKGYDVVAFDMSPALAREGAHHADAESHVQFYRAAYEDLPTLYAERAGEPDLNLEQGSPFDAAVVGWVSYPHVVSRRRRVAALKRMAQVTRGALLISTFPRTTYGGTPIKPRWLRRILPFGLARDPGNAFLPGPGFHHMFDQEEFLSEIRDAGIEVTHIHFPTVWNDRTDCPYAIGVGTSHA